MKQMKRRLNSHKVLRTIFIIIFLVVICATIINIKAMAKETFYSDIIYTISDETIETNQVNKIEVIEVSTFEMHKPETEAEPIIPIYDIPFSTEFQEFTYIICKEEGISYKMAIAVVQLESNFNIKCVSNNYKNKKLVSQDRGLFQINSKYESWYAELAGLKEWDVFNAYDNIRMGIAGLSHYKRYWINKGIEDNTELKVKMLNGYNMGLAGHSKVGYISRAYDRKIFEFKEKLTSY